MALPRRSKCKERNAKSRKPSPLWGDSAILTFDLSFFIPRLIQPTSIVGVGPVSKANSRWWIGPLLADQDGEGAGIRADCDSANFLTGVPIREIMPF